MQVRYPLIPAVVLFAAGITVPLQAGPPDPVTLAARLDGHLNASWKMEGITPGEVTGDAAFLRRASLDLIGRIPTVAETREFLADTRPDRRAHLLNRLIASGGASRHLATFWRRLLLPQADTPEFSRLGDEFEAWLIVRLRDNVPYDRIVRELLTLPVSEQIPTGTARRGVSASAFFAANEGKPENLAASVTRAVLGVNLECAQCHDHPFAKWTRDQFWQTAAFFARPMPVAGADRLELRMAIPNTKRSVTAAMMDRTPLIWPDKITSQTGPQLLANWTTADKNPFFARNAVNRLWAHFYGFGLIEPLDDLGGDSEPAHPELLDELTRAFAESGYDLAYLTRVIVSTKAYQRSAGPVEATGPRLFDRMPVRGLSGEQLYDSLRVAAGLPPERDDIGVGRGLETRRRFAAEFHIERGVQAERSIVQALTLMNGRLIGDLTSPTISPTLAGVIDAPFLNPQQKVETLFLAVLGRTPTAKEAARFVPYVESGGPEKDQRLALADVFWALLNSSEFNTNH